MTKYEVQFELPVDNPAMNVGIRRGKGVTTFFVPINHKDAHNMGYQDLIAAAQLSGRVVLFTDHNNIVAKRPEKSSKGS